VIGAGAVVKADVPAHWVVAGVPAEFIGWACFCGVVLELENSAAQCRECGKRYEVTADGLNTLD